MVKMTAIDTKMFQRSQLDISFGARVLHSDQFDAFMSGIGLVKIASAGAVLCQAKLLARIADIFTP